MPAAHSSRPRAAAGAAVLLVSAAGCGNDYQFSEAPPPIERHALGGRSPLPGGPSGPSLPPPPELPPSPWNALNPGDLPELYFAVAWSDPAGCCYCDYDGAAEMDSEPYACATSYAVVDLQGQVIAEFPLPAADSDGDGFVDSVYGPMHLQLAPAGPG